MRMVHLIAIVLIGPLLMRFAGEEQGSDYIIIMDAAEGDNADCPWQSYACPNPEHFYLKPLAVDETAASLGAEYPPAATGEADDTPELRFSGRFVSDEGARGFQPWNWHFTRDGEGKAVRIENCAGQRTAAVRAIAEALITEILRGGDNRIALLSFLSEDDTRFSMNFTRDREALSALVDAVPETALADRSTALEKAEAYLERRPADDKRAREAIVIIVSGAESDRPEYDALAKESALRLSGSARIIFVSVMNGDDALAGELAGAGVCRIGHRFGESAEATAREALSLAAPLRITPLSASRRARGKGARCRPISRREGAGER